MNAHMNAHSNVKNAQMSVHDVHDAHMIVHMSIQNAHTINLSTQSERSV